MRNAAPIKRVVVGLGVTGESIIKFLASRDMMFDVVDTRENVIPSASIKKIMKQCGAVLAGKVACKKLVVVADEIYLSPGIGVEEFRDQYPMKSSAKVTGDLDLFMRHVNAPAVLITGSNAKTTVTTLVGEIAKNAGINVGIGGNIGVPMLDVLSCGHDLYVLEISSFQLERVEQLHSEVAVVLNITDDHLDRHRSMVVYSAIKQRIYEHTKRAIYNRDDQQTKPDSDKLGDREMQLASYGMGRNNAHSSSDLSESQLSVGMVDGRECIMQGGRAVMATSNISLLGRHNIPNIMAALAIGDALGINIESMVETVKQFSGLPHRCEFVREVNGVRYINDSKATNVGATIAAIQGLCFGASDYPNTSKKNNSRLMLIAGGVTKNADFSELASQLRQVDCVLILIGEGAAEIAAACSGQSVTRVDSMRQAIELSAQLAVSGDSVLLSPACASFDMYASFEERGDDFKINVARIAEILGSEVGV